MGVRVGRGVGDERRNHHPDILNKGDKAKKQGKIYPRMYGYKTPQAKDSLEDTIVVHTMERFNATRLIPPVNLKNI